LQITIRNFIFQAITIHFPGKQKEQYALSGFPYSRNPEKFSGKNEETQQANDMK